MGVDDDGSLEDVQDDSSAATRDFVVNGSGFAVCVGCVLALLVVV